MEVDLSLHPIFITQLTGIKIEELVIAERLLLIEIKHQCFLTDFQMDTMERGIFL